MLLANSEAYAWTGPLSLPSTIAVDTIAGLWVDQGVSFNNPVHAASVPANPTGPGRSGRRPGVARQLGVGL